MSTAARILFLLALGMSLSACPKADNAPKSDSTPAGEQAMPAQNVITGNATYREKLKMAPGASLRVQLIDNQLADSPQAVIAETTVTGIDHGSPIAFTLPFDPAKLRANGQYGLHASMYDVSGELIFVTDTRVPVTPGDGKPVELPMRMVGGGDDAGSSPWDDAKARGIGFRAVGNEPGWFAEVGMGEAPSLHAELDYGERMVDVGELQSLSGLLGYAGTAHDGAKVRLVIERKSCSDGMSDATYPASAELTVGDRTYRGCGRFLSE